MYDDCVCHMKEENKSLTPFIGKKTLTPPIQKTRPVQKNSANTYRIGRVFLYWLSFSILAVFVAGIMRADLAIQILYCCS